jgi:hypothetical protein
VRRNQPTGRDRADAEERAVGERGDDPGRDDGLVGGRDRRQGVAHDEHHHERHEVLTRGEPDPERGQHGRADDDAECVCGDQHAHRGHGDPEAVGDLGQHAHDHELRGADAEGADGQGEKCTRHEAVLQRKRVGRGKRPADGVVLSGPG